MSKVMMVKSLCPSGTGPDLHSEAQQVDLTISTSNMSDGARLCVQVSENRLSVF